jgi:hypothetical protein
MRRDEPAGTGSRKNSGSMSQIIQLLEDATARIICIEQALEDGDTSMAYTLARDLEPDLRSAISVYGEAA